jgi:hypothetical protein
VQAIGFKKNRKNPHKLNSQKRFAKVLKKMKNRLSTFK